MAELMRAGLERPKGKRIPRPLDETRDGYVKMI
jgi:hypothetical protein